MSPKMFHKSIVFFSVTMSLLGCGGTCPDGEQFLGTFELTPFEKSLIPFDDYDELIFINQDDETVIGRTQPRTLEQEKVNTGPEVCEAWETQVLRNYINFIDLGFTIGMEITTLDGGTTFKIDYFEIDNVFGNETFPTLKNPGKLDSQPLNLAGFEFEEVYLFTNSDSNGKVDTILYSSIGDGLEFILFRDDSYLKIVE